MESPLFYRIAADALLLLHVLFVAFVICGLIAIYAGAARNWGWVRNPWFRLTHVAAIVVVTLQSWLGVLCPLTNLEMWLRSRAGEATYSGAFIAHWMGKILYYNAAEWVFILCYTVFGALVLASWLVVRPRSFRSKP